MRLARTFVVTLTIAAPAFAGAQTFDADTRASAPAPADHPRSTLSAAIGPDALSRWTHTLQTRSVAPVPVRASAQQGQGSAATTAERTGFIIGFGAGAGLHRVPDLSFTTSDGQVIVLEPGTNGFTIATDFKIGWGISDNLLAYYVNHAAFGGSDRYDAVGLSGAGVTYMVQPTSPTAYFTGGIGAGAGRNVIETSDPEGGLGYSVGAGFEFARHWSVDGAIIGVRLGDNDDHTVFRAALHYLFY